VGAGPAGAYHRLPVAGPDADRVLAFARGAGPDLAAVVARPRQDGRIDAQVVLPDGPWTSCFTGEASEGIVALADLHARFPVALLER
jgi:maltooligosyltrehalose synthase